MRKIVIGASKPKVWKPLAAVIMWWEETPASHAYAYIERSTGKKMVYHAVGAGTNFMGYTQFLSINTAVYEKEIEVSEEIFNTLIDTMIDRLWCKYSFKHLIGLFYKRAIQYIFKKIIKNPFADKDRSSVCVETICTLVDLAKLREIAEDPEDMGMYEFLTMLKAIPGKELFNG